MDEQTIGINNEMKQKKVFWHNMYSIATVWPWSVHSWYGSYVCDGPGHVSFAKAFVIIPNWPTDWPIRDNNNMQSTKTYHFIFYIIANWIETYDS